MIIAAAVVIVWLNRRTMFQSGSGVTDVLMPVDNGGISRQKIGQNAVIPLGESHRIAVAEMTKSSDTSSIR